METSCDKIYLAGSLIPYVYYGDTSKRASSFRQNNVLWLKHSIERLRVFCFLLENRIFFPMLLKAIFKRRWHQFIASFIVNS